MSSPSPNSPPPSFPSPSSLSSPPRTDEVYYMPLYGPVSKDTLHLLIRLVLILGTYMLFRPYLDKLFRKISGEPTEKEQEAEILKVKMAAILKEREKQDLERKRELLKKARSVASQGQQGTGQGTGTEGNGVTKRKG